MVNQTIPTDEELIRQVQSGRLEGFNQLYERHLPAVFNRVRYRIPAADVEDVTQEVFMTAVRSLKSFRGQSQFSTWLRTLTNRRVADYYRSRRQIEVELKEPLSESHNSALHVPSKAGAADDRIVIRQAMGRLPDHYQEVLLLRFAEGLKFKEIAVTMGQSLEATKSLYRRAVETLRNHLEEFDV